MVAVVEGLSGDKEQDCCDDGDAVEGDEVVATVEAAEGSFLLNCSVRPPSNWIVVPAV